MTTKQLEGGNVRGLEVLQKIIKKKTKQESATKERDSVFPSSGWQVVD